jgi:outer membrane protein assembly factor BamD (BamD/ComL family)
MIDINTLQMKLQQVLQSMEKSQVNDFKQGNINSLIKDGSEQLDTGNYNQAISQLTEALEELNKYAIDLMQAPTPLVENRYEKKNKDK